MQLFFYFMQVSGKRVISWEFLGSQIQNPKDCFQMQFMLNYMEDLKVNNIVNGIT